jgi:hypothetical protein
LESRVAECPKEKVNVNALWPTRIMRGFSLAIWFSPVVPDRKVIYTVIFVRVSKEMLKPYVTPPKKIHTCVEIGCIKFFPFFEH